MANVAESSTKSALAALTPGTWTVDTSHSTVAFMVRHLMVAKVRGRFSTFSGTIEVGADPLQSKVEATVDASSVNTDDEGRDNHLRTADFFDTENHPNFTLVSTGIDPDGGDYVLHTQLTLHGVTKPVDFALEFDGVQADPWGNQRAGFTAETEISRKDFGIEFNMPLDGGGVVVGDKVKITLEIEAVKAA